MPSECPLPFQISLLSKVFLYPLPTCVPSRARAMPQSPSPSPTLCLEHGSYAVNVIRRTNKWLTHQHPEVLPGCNADFQAVLECIRALLSRYRITGISLSVLKQIDPSEQKTLANLPWIVEPGQEAKRGINTKYETTIF